MNDEVQVQDQQVNEEESNELVILDPDAYEVDLNHGRIGKLENLECLHQVEGLYLRWNMIKKIENIQTLTTLRELELYDNQITVIENLDTLVNLEYVSIHTISNSSITFLVQVA